MNDSDLSKPQLLLGVVGGGILGAISLIVLKSVAYTAAPMPDWLYSAGIICGVAFGAMFTILS